MSIAKKQSKDKLTNTNLVNLLVDANIKVRELHDILDQTNIAHAAGVTKQAIQGKAMRRVKA